MIPTGKIGHFTTNYRDFHVPKPCLQPLENTTRSTASALPTESGGVRSLEHDAAELAQSPLEQAVGVDGSNRLKVLLQTNRRGLRSDAPASSAPAASLQGHAHTTPASAQAARSLLGRPDHLYGRSDAAPHVSLSSSPGFGG